MLLRKSEFAGQASYGSTAELVATVLSPDPHGDRKELADLIRVAGEITRKEVAAR